MKNGNRERDELIEMMSSYWACDNNAQCWLKTTLFLEKYGISIDEINICDEWEFDEEELKELRKELLGKVK